MNTTVLSSLSAAAPDASIVVFAFSDQEPTIEGLPEAVTNALGSGYVRRDRLDVTPVFDGATRFLVVGLGESGDFRPVVLKRAAGAAVCYLKARGGGRVACVLPQIAGAAPERAAALIVAGAVLGAHSAALYKSGDAPKPITDLALVAPEGADAVAEAAHRAQIITEAANFARDLVNAPANDLPPAELARRAAEAGREAGLEVQVFGREEIEQHKMAGILAVNSGSANAPSFTILKHMPNPGEAPIVLVGKGISFDTGGISIKGGADMHHMKGDMGGAAAVIGALVAAGRLNLPRNVVGLIPSAENMPDGAAYRPSDVLTYANGKTVEIVNTDAEGRLVLADALIYGEREFQPEAMVDLATLTGACVIALGTDVAGVFTDDEDLARRLDAASRESTEPAWRLPLYHDYRCKFDSGVADMKNAGDRWGGSITAALLLAEFVENTPWAHLDVAGPAFDDTEHAYMARGGTGYGVALLVEFLSNK